VSDQPAKPHWLVRCSCGWTTTLSAEWAAQSAAKIHASLGWTKREHVVSVVASGEPKEQDQPSLWEDQDGER
jgi:hypothetical protein